MKPRRSIRSKSVPTDQSPKKSFLTNISRRFSLSAIRRPSSQRLSDDEDRVIQEQPQAAFQEPESPPTTASRISRRASRFWSASSANYFEDNTPAQASSPPGYEGAAYVPRHAAADFSKTASNRLTVMVEADETTLCSFNCSPSGNRITAVEDDEQSEEGASHHRQQALAALTARSRSIAASSDGDRDGNNDYTVFLEQAAADQETRARRSAAAWAELEHRTTHISHRTSGADPLITRQSRGQSAYLGVHGSVSGSSRPVSSIAISIAEYIRPSHVGRAW
ncbi:hypothetical protein NCS57_00854400 [Fusarium keratoplasticum]|uniref:Uncharacterized protein n=1 Tax=Fusarium keratoplasticum TaxID=1328300 RepID=A0ACC0QT31_9HYPO|nr:hypothetical protein NCS57_00854400 [Fusarium keratoplasticum]KAI8666299.1 hypothetical protein NCS57_00854400 [Fusarium keratoplasticum]